MLRIGKPDSSQSMTRFEMLIILLDSQEHFERRDDGEENPLGG